MLWNGALPPPFTYVVAVKEGEGEEGGPCYTAPFASSGRLSLF